MNEYIYFIDHCDIFVGNITLNIFFEDDFFEDEKREDDKMSDIEMLSFL